MGCACVHARVCACGRKKKKLVLDTTCGSLNDAPLSLCPDPLGSRALPVVSMASLEGWTGKSQSSFFSGTWDAGCPSVELSMRVGLRALCLQVPNGHLELLKWEPYICPSVFILSSAWATIYWSWWESLLQFLFSSISPHHECALP